MKLGLLFLCRIRLTVKITPSKKLRVSGQNQWVIVTLTLCSLIILSFDFLLNLILIKEINSFFIYQIKPSVSPVVVVATQCFRAAFVLSNRALGDDTRQKFRHIIGTRVGSAFPSVRIYTEQCQHSVLHVKRFHRRRMGEGQVF